MYQDEIIWEVWENRKKFSDRHNHDIDAMVEELMAGQSKTTRSVVDRRGSPDKAVRFGLSAVSGKLRRKKDDSS